MSGNTLGKLFSVTSFGESHGPAIGCVVDGCPPGLELSAEDIQLELDRRKPGTSRHVTQRRESDTVEILSGVFEGKTTGTPIALLIRNEDQRSKDYGNIAETFRPGHADYTYRQKYGIRDHRGGGRSCARETAVRVAAGAIAKKWLQERYGVVIRGYLSQLGPIVVPFKSWDDVSQNPFFVADCSYAQQLEDYMDALRKSGDSIGAKLTVVAENVPVGWGEPVYDRLDADIAYALMSINAVKGVEIGAGFGCVTQKGSEHGDELTPAGLPVQPRRRHSGRHFQRPGRRRAHRHQAHLQHPHPAPLHQHGGRTHHGGNPWPPRPLRRHPRHAHRRGHAGHRADGPCAAPPRAECRCGVRNTENPGASLTAIHETMDAASALPGPAGAARAVARSLAGTESPARPDSRLSPSPPASQVSCQRRPNCGHFRLPA